MPLFEFLKTPSALLPPAPRSFVLTFKHARFYFIFVPTLNHCKLWVPWDIELKSLGMEILYHKVSFSRLEGTESSSLYKKALKWPVPQRQTMQRRHRNRSKGARPCCFVGKCLMLEATICWGWNDEWLSKFCWSVKFFSDAKLSVLWVLCSTNYVIRPRVVLVGASQTFCSFVPDAHKQFKWRDLHPEIGMYGFLLLRFLSFLFILVGCPGLQSAMHTCHRGLPPGNVFCGWKSDCKDRNSCRCSMLMESGMYHILWGSRALCLAQFLFLELQKNNQRIKTKIKPSGYIEIVRW